MLSTTTIREVQTPSGNVVTVEHSRPSLLSRLATMAFLALAVAAGILIFIPIAIMGLALVISFAIYLFLYRLVSRPRAPTDEGRENVRVIVRDSSAP